MFFIFLHCTYAAPLNEESLVLKARRASRKTDAILIQMHM